jgi:hypothetical protein
MTFWIEFLARITLLGRLADKAPTPIDQVADGTVVRIVGRVVHVIPLVVDDGTGRAVVDLDPSIGDQAWLHDGKLELGEQVTVLGPAMIERDLTALCERGYRDESPGCVRMTGTRRIPLCLTDDLAGVARRA